MNYSEGDRVRILESYHWAKGAFGTVAPPPGPVALFVTGAEAWRGCHRVVKGVKGPIDFYWVEFDEAQVDADGDGPYASAEIQAEYLEHVASRS
jgi:hypothetical protein